MTIEDIKSYISQHFAQANVLEAAGDLFFMHEGNDKLPFATIVNKR